MTKKNDESNNKFYVYAYIDPNNNLVRYIGKGLGDRAYNLKRGYVVGRWLEKLKRNGQKPVIKILHENLTEDEAFEYEIFYINFYGKATDYTGILFNIADGGQGVRCKKSNRIIRTPSQETLEILKNASTGRLKSDETKKIMSEKAKARQSNRLTPVIVYGVEYPDVKTAAKAINLSYARLSYKLSRGTDPDIKYKNDEEVRIRLAKRSNRLKSQRKNCEKYLDIELNDIMSTVISKFYKICELEDEIYRLKTNNLTEKLKNELIELDKETD